MAVVDQEQKNQLQAAAWGQEQVRDASVVIVIAGDLKAHQWPKLYLRDAPEAVREQFEPMVKQFHEGNDSIICDEACRSVGLAAMNLMLAAHGLGYESGPMIGFDPAKVSEAVGLDEDHPPLMLVVVGKAVKPAHSRLGLFNLEEVVSVDRFGDHSMSGEVEG